MTAMMTISPPALRLVRLPGEYGPILRCRGELSVATAEALRRELALLEPLNHPVITVNLTDCTYLDVDGILTILQSLKRRRDEGRRLVVVAGPGAIGRMLHVSGIDWVVPVFPSEEVAMLALRGGGPPLPAPDTWEAARAATLGRWRSILEAVDSAPAEETLELLTSMTSLCDRSEEIYQQHSRPARALGAPWLPLDGRQRREARCECCPLFHALGSKPEDIGCHSVLAPIIEALGANSRDVARTQVKKMIRLIQEMPLPVEATAPPVLSFVRSEEVISD
jgi:anti-anti-sigma factor